MKILIAYYSRTGNTEVCAKVLEKEFKKRGHSVDIEKVNAVKKHSVFYWWNIRQIKGRCPIQKPKILDVSSYDAICIGSPNWTRIALPVAEYLYSIKGLEYKKIGLFATTAAIPKLEWYFFSAYLLDLTFSKIVEKKKARFVHSVLLSSLVKRWNIYSKYGQKCVKEFCDKIEGPDYSLKEYTLAQKEKNEVRSSIVVISTFLSIFLFSQAICAVLGLGICNWKQYFPLFLLGFFAYNSMLVMMEKKLKMSWGKYIVACSLSLGWTLMILSSGAILDKSVILGYVLSFIIASFFRDVKTVIFTGLVSLSGYIFLLFCPCLQLALTPVLDILSLFIGLGVVAFITQDLKQHYLESLDTQDKLEASKMVLEIRVKARTRELELLTEQREKIIEKRTKDLNEKVQELTKFNKLTIGRELKMVALKKEIKILEKEIKRLKES